MNEDFYIGYLPKAPVQFARFVKPIVAGLMAAAVALAVVLVFAQNPFAASFFEYGNNRDFYGTIQLDPYPSLLVGRPVAETTPYSRYLLVAPGKHGADSMLAPFAGKSVKLQGQLIYRGADTMIEVVPGSVSALEGVVISPHSQDLGPATLTGEIVDTKCYLGVMNPGSGKVHRDCAARCLSGGIPPGFIARDKEGRVRVYLLTNSNGQPITKEIIGKIGEPVTLSGRIKREGDSLFFEIGKS